MARFPASDSNILTLLKESRTAYIIPRYQRSYAWEEQPHLSDLWDDISETIINRGEELFTGTIILSKTDTNLLSGASDELYYKDVIDGQQRLTTILILLRALYDSFTTESGKKWADANIYTPYFFATKGEYKLRLSQEDQKFFEDYILNVESFSAPSRSRQKPSEKRLGKALTFFREKISTSVGDEDIEVYAENFFNKLRDNLVVVLIEARSDVDAYTIFETINSKNRALTPSELLKNYFYSVASTGKGVLNTITSHWEGITDELSAKEIEVTEYVRHYWVSTHEGKVSEKKLYRAIKDDIKRELSKVETLVANLRKEVTFYSEMVNPLESTKDEVEKYFGQLRELGIRQCYPLILALKAIGYEDIGQILKNIIFTSLSRSVADKNPNELEKLYSEYSYRIRQEGDDVVEEFLTKLKVFKLSDEEFENALVNASLSPKTGKFILMRLEEARKTGETQLHSRDVEIEHIMPGSPESIDDWGVTSEEHKVWLETLGNKTLIGSKFNKTVSNKSFANKKPVYRDSDIKMTKELATYPAWSIGVIQERTRNLAKELIKIYS